MDKDKVKVAEGEAKRFLERVARWRESEQRIDVEETVGCAPFSYNIHGRNESGALRRSSMDLSAALSNMRKG